VLRRASDRLAHFDRHAPHAVDVTGLVRYADALIDSLAAGVDVTPTQLRPRLTCGGSNKGDPQSR
jgi:hypothetical protein